MPHRSLARAVLAAALVALAPTSLAAQATALDSTHRSTTVSDTTHPRAHTLPPVRVVAERTRRADAASSVVISPEVVRTAPATNAWDLVRQTAGVEVHQQGQGPGFASDAVIRGFTSDHSSDVALVIDGIPANQPINGHAEGYADWNEILPEAVSSIRVLKGPASPWVGNFGMGGVVEVQTAPVATGTRLSLRSGSYGDLRGSVVTGNAGEGGGWVAAAGAQREDGWRPNSRSSMEHLLGSRTWLGKSGRSFTLGASGYAAQWDSPGFLTVDQFDAHDFDVVADRTDGGNLGLVTLRGALSTPAGGGELQSTLYARGRDWHLFLNIPPEGGIGEGAPSQTEELDRRIEGGGHTQYSHQLGAAHVIAQLDYRAVRAGYERYFDTRRRRDSVFAFDGGTPGRLNATYLAAAPAVEVHWDVTSALDLGLGGRVDWLHYARTPKDGGGTAAADHAIATPKLSALYRLGPVLSAYAAFNGGFRSPDGVLADPSLEPVREWASEVGLRASSDRFEGSIALFEVDVRHELTANPLNVEEIVARGSSRRAGIEVDGRVGIVPAIALFTHATVNDAKYLHLVTEDGDTLDDKPVFGVARATVEAGVDAQWRGAVGSVWAAYTGRFTPIGEPDERTSPYTLVNLRGVIPVAHRWSIAVGVQNLFDRTYPEVRASGFVSPGQPRTILLSVRREE